MLNSLAGIIKNNSPVTKDVVQYGLHVAEDEYRQSKYSPIGIYMTVV